MNALDSPERDRAAQRRNAAQVSVVCLRVVRERFHVCHRIHTGYPCRTAVPSPLYLRSLAPVVARPVGLPYRASALGVHRPGYRVFRPGA